MKINLALSSQSHLATLSFPLPWKKERRKEKKVPDTSFLFFPSLSCQKKKMLEFNFPPPKVRQLGEEEELENVEGILNSINFAHCNGKEDCANLWCELHNNKKC